MEAFLVGICIFAAVLYLLKRIKTNLQAKTGGCACDRHCDGCPPSRDKRFLT